MIGHRNGVALVALAIAGSLLSPSLALSEQHNFTIPVQEKTVDIGSGLKYDAWTYGGTVPGPILRVRQGDKVHLHLVNDIETAHESTFMPRRLRPASISPRFAEKPTSATTSSPTFLASSCTIAARRRWSPISPTECMR